MKKSFYPRLAFDGIRKNKRLYLPYILTQIGMIMMYYIVIFLRYGESLKGTFGEGTVSIVLMLGGWVIAIFACIFLFYTNSFLIRRRKNLSTATTGMNKAMERLSTGYKINSGADDAAGSSVSTLMEAQISGYDVAESNAAMGIMW